MAFGYEQELKAEIARLLAAGDRLESQMIEACRERDRLRDALDEQAGRAAWNYDCLTQCEERAIQRDAEIERLRLTDAEREAIQWAAGQARLFPEFDSICGHAVTLRGLLERMGDCPTPDNAADRDSGTTGSE